jgi:hypothetical protein
MAKIGRRPTDDQLLEGGGGGGAGAGISGTKWSKMPSFKGNSDAVSDIKKLTKDTSHLKGGARDASDEAKGRAATRTAVRAAGVAAVNEGTKAALNNTASAKEDGGDSFKEMERALRAADADIEASKYGKGDGMKKGGSVKGWGISRGARKAKMY